VIIASVSAAMVSVFIVCFSLLRKVQRDRPARVPTSLNSVRVPISCLEVMQSLSVH